MQPIRTAFPLAIGDNGGTDCVVSMGVHCPALPRLAVQRLHLVDRLAFALHNNVLQDNVLQDAVLLYLFVLTTAPVLTVLTTTSVCPGVQRAALAAQVVNDPTALKTLEGIVHPLVKEARDAMVAATTSDVVVFDIPLLYETNAVSEVVAAGKRAWLCRTTCAQCSTCDLLRGSPCMVVACFPFLICGHALYNRWMRSRWSVRLQNSSGSG